jgi:hypothetical protein
MRRRIRSFFILSLCLGVAALGIKILIIAGILVADIPFLDIYIVTLGLCTMFSGVFYVIEIRKVRPKQKRITTFKQKIFVGILKEVISYAEIEIKNINDGKESIWTVGQIENGVLPEVRELLSYALNGIVHYKYGEKQRLLESAYIMTDSLEHLDNTALGKQIDKLQNLYFTI